MEALILVDIQNDFLPGGALAVPHGDEVVPVANKLIPFFELVVATQDWHPANHGSFASQHPGKKPGDVIDLAGQKQVLWPDHCVQETDGAQYAPDLNLKGIHRAFMKGTDPAIDSYSGFFDNGHRRATGLGDYLQSKRVNRVFIMGLATDYCIKATALDARTLDLDTFVITQGVRGVDLQPGDSEAALREMKAAGVHIVSERDVVRRHEQTRPG